MIGTTETPNKSNNYHTRRIISDLILCSQSSATSMTGLGDNIAVAVGIGVVDIYVRCVVPVAFTMPVLWRCWDCCCVCSFDCVSVGCPRYERN